MCIFILVRFFPSTLFSHAFIYICAFFESPFLSSLHEAQLHTTPFNEGIGATTTVAPLHNHGGTANSNGDENAHAISFKEVTKLRVIDEKESKSRLKEQFGKHCHSSRREEVLWNRGLSTDRFPDLEVVDFAILIHLS